jgi:hypothetical protein
MTAARIRARAGDVRLKLMANAEGFLMQSSRGRLALMLVARCLHPLLACALGAAAACALPAQRPFSAADFLPDGYRNLVFVDFAQLRESGVWDEMNTGALALGLRSLAGTLECSFDALDRFTMVPRWVQRDDGQDGFVNVMVVQANAPFAPPTSEEARSDSMVVEQLGDATLRYQEGLTYGTLEVSDRARVMGELALLRARVGEGRARGRPCPDVLSLFSSQRQGLLACVVVDLFTQGLSAGTTFHEELQQLLPGAEWPADGVPNFGMLRVAAAGDPDDPHVVLDVVLRHKKPGEGVALTERAVKAAFAQLDATPRLRAVKRAFGVPRFQVDGSDLSVSFDLGRARTVSSVYEQLAMLMIGEVFVYALPIPGSEDAPEAQAAERVPDGKKHEKKGHDHK